MNLASKHLSIVLVLLVSCTSTAAFAIPVNDLIGQAALEGSDEKKLAGDLEKFLVYTQKYPDAVTGCVLVAKGGRILVARGFGIADEDSGKLIGRENVWDIASCSKQFTAAAILLMQQKDELSLDDPLKKFFDEVPENKSSVTIRQLLNHTSGIANSYDHAEAAKTVNFGNKNQAIKFYLNLPMESKPGKKWAYSNLAYNIVGAIIENVSGHSWEDYMREHIFRPAGMKHTWCLGDPSLPIDRVPRGAKGTGPAFPYGLKSHWAGYRGAGGVHTTVDDLFRWDQVLRSDDLLNAKSRRELYRIGLDDYALGWKVKQDLLGDKRADHGGFFPGFTSQIIRCLDEEIVVAVMTNENPGNHSKLAEALYHMVRIGHAIGPPSDAVEPKQEDLDRLTGIYRSESGEQFSVTSSQQGLRIGVPVSDWDTVGSWMRAQGKIVNGGATVDKSLPNVIQSLTSGTLDDIPAKLSDEQAKLAKEVLSGKSDMGAYKAAHHIGYYFEKVGVIEHFVTLEFADNKKKLVRFQWDFGKLNQFDVNPDPFIYAEFQPMGANIFRQKEIKSWNALLFKFSDSGSLRVNENQNVFVRVDPKND